MDLLTQEEIPRIEQYQKKGDVAGVEEGIAYLQYWKSQQDQS